ncbi:MAG: TolC family protein, partial [Thermoleophilia bacterium]|nr:TolC family protein [Thermoleophilia bacterium]
MAALFFNPSFAQTVDIGRGDAYETNNIRAPRATEPVAPLTLKAALELALCYNACLSAAGRELEAVVASFTMAK